MFLSSAQLLLILSACLFGSSYSLPVIEPTAYYQDFLQATPSTPTYFSNIWRKNSESSKQQQTQTSSLKSSPSPSTSSMSEPIHDDFSDILQMQENQRKWNEHFLLLRQQSGDVPKRRLDEMNVIISQCLYFKHQWRQCVEMFQ